MGHLLLEVKCLAKLRTLALNFYIIGDKLQIQYNLGYYFALHQSANLVIKIKHLIND